jgi:ATP-dependent DNA ligase
MLQRSARAIRLIGPCLPSPAKAAPSGLDWLHEIKHDGFRILARRDAKGVRLISRNGNDFSKRFPLVVASVMALPVRSCLIDGEVIVIDEAGLATAICAGLTSTSNVWSRKREKLFKRKRDAATG